MINQSKISRAKDIIRLIKSKNINKLIKRLNKMDNTRDLEELNKLGVQLSYSKEELENLMNVLTKPSDYLTKPMTLEERQRNWDIQYDSPDSEPVKSRPTRPSKEQDELVEQMKQPQSTIDKLKPLQLKENIRQYIEEKDISKEHKLKGELIHLIMSNINPQELKWIEEHKGTEPTTKLEQMYLLIGKIIDKVK